MTDNINHPGHYTGRDIGHECIDLTQYQTFCVGNVIKYLWRYKTKGNPAEDLKKARWYATKASTRQEPVNTKTGNSREILVDLVASTTRYEAAAWVGLLWGKWYIVLSALDMMIKETQMANKLTDIPLDQLLIEHYLFDLDQSAEKTAEILDMDEETVRHVHQESLKFYSTIRKDHR